MQWCAQYRVAHFQTIGSCIRYLRSHLGNKWLSIIGYLDELRAVGSQAVECTIRRLESAQYDAVHFTAQHRPKVPLNLPNSFLMFL
ncbi:hypothetical protein RHMOL_Rhmol13G0134100 [Rhododendron molle]|uniref:Uncharacterized protein n=1 Tax=Rhododendron molle TaxID=49168 RepID=A0ACC0L689_RHOML|nr:hypothetical protein RHMOL_Rhmol13G0134100 [Rhododendron molle]